MSEPTAKQPNPLPIVISAPELWRLSFERRPDTPWVEGTDPTLNTGLGVTRTAEDEIEVELSVSIEEGAPFSVFVGYRARFHVQSTEGLGSLEQVLSTIAARIAPTTLYPFVREAIGNALMRAGIQAPLLPILNFGTMFNPGEIEVPPPPE